MLGRIYPFKNFCHIDDAFKDYVLNRLTPLLGLRPGDCLLEMPLIGRKSCIRFLKTSSGKAYAIRAFSFSQKRLIQQLKASDEVLKANEVPAPRIIDLAEKHSEKGISFLTEEFIQGRNFENLEPDPGIARKLGTLLSSLHKQTRDQWGSLVKPPKKGALFAASQFKWVKHRLHRIKKFAPDDLDRSEISRVRRWFQACSKKLNSIASFHLIHGKINRGNVILSPDSYGIFLVDFATLHYGYRGKDLSQAEFSLLKGKKELTDAFLGEYFSSLPGQARTEYDNLSEFYRAYYLLSRCAAHLRRAAHLRDKNNATLKILHKSFLTHWKLLLDIVNS